MPYTSLREQERRKALVQQLRSKKNYARSPFGALAQGLNAYTAGKTGRKLSEATTENREIEQSEMMELIKRSSPDYEKNRQSTITEALRNAPEGELMEAQDAKTFEYQSPLAQQLAYKSQLEDAKAGRVMSPEQEAQKIRVAQAGRSQFGQRDHKDISRFKYWQSLSEDEQKDMLNVARASKTLDLTDRQVVLDPTDPTKIDASFDKNLAPKDEPTNIADAETAKKEAALDVKRKEEQPQAKLRLSTITKHSGRLKIAALELMNHAGLDNITGFIFGRIPTLSQEGRNAQELLNHIKNVVFVNTLQSMREASKTGGAVGNVSDREGDRLENAMVAVGQSQDTETFKARLQDVADIVDEMNDGLQTAYDDTYNPQTEDEGWTDL